MDHDREPADVAIVGGGASGTLLATHLLLRGAPEDGSVVLVERREACGLGVAYSTVEPAHLLNVPAASMSAVHDEPTHFVDWLEGADVSAEEFVTRATYGRYLRSVLEIAERESDRPFVRLRGAVTDVRTDSDGAVVDVVGAQPLRARRVVFALGNPPPGTPSFLSAVAGEGYVADTWAASALQDIPTDDSVLLVGTGLTAIDVALALAAAGHQGPIHAVSRHGLLPQVHRAPAERIRSFRDLPSLDAPITMRRLVRWVRDEVRAAESEGADWRDVINSIRPWTQRLWMQLSLEQRGIFLRHLQRHWSIHRHRMAPEVGRSIERMRHSGQLTVHGGDVRITKDSAGFDVEVASHGEGGEPVRLSASRVVNCTGPDIDPARSTEPLVCSLLERGEARRDPLGLGFDCTPEGAIIDSSGVASGTLLAIGPPRTGSLWESTAIPEIREQAFHLSQAIEREDALVRRKR